MADQGLIAGLLAAISGQESGGRYGIVNPDSGALGRYQIMPANVRAWSRKHLGREIDPQTFLRSPDLQDQIAQAQVGEYWDKAIERYGDPEVAAKRVAADWYGGPGSNMESVAKQGKYPSIRDYAKQVTGRMGQADHAPAPSAPQITPSFDSGPRVRELPEEPQITPIVDPANWRPDPRFIMPGAPVLGGSGIRDQGSGDRAQGTGFSFADVFGDNITPPAMPGPVDYTPPAPPPVGGQGWQRQAAQPPVVTGPAARVGSPITNETATPSRRRVRPVPPRVVSVGQPQMPATVPNLAEWVAGVQTPEPNTAATRAAYNKAADTDYYARRGAQMDITAGAPDETAPSREYANARARGMTHEQAKQAVIGSYRNVEQGRREKRMPPPVTFGQSVRDTIAGGIDTVLGDKNSVAGIEDAPYDQRLGPKVADTLMSAGAGAANLGVDLGRYVLPAVTGQQTAAVSNWVEDQLLPPPRFAGPDTTAADQASIPIDRRGNFAQERALRAQLGEGIPKVLAMVASGPAAAEAVGADAIAAYVTKQVATRLGAQAARVAAPQIAEVVTQFLAARAGGAAAGAATVAPIMGIGSVFDYQADQTLSPEENAANFFKHVATETGKGAIAGGVMGALGGATNPIARTALGAGGMYAGNEAATALLGGQRTDADRLNDLLFGGALGAMHAPGRAPERAGAEETTGEGGRRAPMSDADLPGSGGAEYRTVMREVQMPDGTTQTVQQQVPVERAATSARSVVEDVREQLRQRGLSADEIARATRNPGEVAKLAADPDFWKPEPLTVEGQWSRLLPPEREMAARELQSESAAPGEEIGNRRTLGSSDAAVSEPVDSLKIKEGEGVRTLGSEAEESKSGPEETSTTPRTLAVPPQVVTGGRGTVTGTGQPVAAQGAAGAVNQATRAGSQQQPVSPVVAPGDRAGSQATAEQAGTREAEPRTADVGAAVSFQVNGKTATGTVTRDLGNGKVRIRLDTAIGRTRNVEKGVPEVTVKPAPTEEGEEATNAQRIEQPRVEPTGAAGSSPKNAGADGIGVTPARTATAATTPAVEEAKRGVDSNAVTRVQPDATDEAVSSVSTPANTAGETTPVAASKPKFTRDTAPVATPTVGAAAAPSQSSVKVLPAGRFKKPAKEETKDGTARTEPTNGAVAEEPAEHNGGAKLERDVEPVVNDAERAPGAQAEGASTPNSAKEEARTPAEAQPAKDETSVEPAEGRKHKFSSTQVNAPEPIQQAHTALQGQIADEDLAGDGKDVGQGLGAAHVTVRYGIASDDPESVRAAIEQHGPFTVKLGKTEAFEPGPGSDGAAVIYAPVDGEGLHAINASVDQSDAPLKSNDYEYKPHMTVAYVKPEAAEKYKGMTGLEGQTFTVDRVVFGDRDGNEHEIELKGEAKDDAATNTSVSVQPGGKGVGVAGDRGGRPAAVQDGAQTKGADAPVAAEKEARTKEGTKPAKDEASVTPVAEPGAEVRSVADHRAVLDRLNAGDLTADELRGAVDSMIANKAAIVADLGKRTLAKLKADFPSFYPPRNKADAVDGAWNQMVHALHLEDSLSFDPMRDSLEAAARRSLDSVTDEQIQKRATDRAAKIEKNKTFREKALANPETEAEFAYFIRAKGKDALTSEQRAQIDEIIAAKNRSTKQADVERKATVAKVDTGSVGMSIKETKHSKLGHALFVVQLDGRVDGETFKDLAAKARQIGGNYSSFIKADAGFQFKTREAAEKFMALREGSVSRADQIADRRQEAKTSAVEHLRSMADRMEESANEVLGRDRKTNTARRAEQAAGAIANANKSLAMAQTMRNIADAIESGEATHLDYVRAKTHVETLNLLAQRAMYAADQALRRRYEEGKLPVLDDIEYAKYPFPRVSKTRLRNLLKLLDGKPGGKLLARQYEQAIGYITDSEPILLANSQMDVVRRLLDKTKSLAERGSRFGDWEATKDAFTELDQLQAMELPDQPSLRAALREYLKFKESPVKESGLQKAERDLVGMKIEGYFPTPKEMADDVVERADIKPGMVVLEPSAGKGSLADAVRRAEPNATLQVGEISSTLSSILRQKGLDPSFSDFMAFNPGETYDRIVMNPPFEQGRDIDHVRHAFDLLKPGGRLVAIMSEGPFFRSDKKATAFREWLEGLGGTSEKNAEGSFKSSDRPTGVATRTVVIEKPKAPEAAATVPSSVQIREPEAAAPTAKFGKTYTVANGNRFRRVEVADNGQTYTYDVRTRTGRDGAEALTPAQIKAEALQQHARKMKTTPVAVPEPANAEEIAAPASKANPYDAKTGLTKNQKEYLAGELETIVHDGMTSGGTGRPVKIDIPGDGSFTVTSVQGANSLHRAVTGKPVEADLDSPKVAPLRKSTFEVSPRSTPQRASPAKLAEQYEKEAVALEAEKAKLDRRSASGYTGADIARQRELPMEIEEARSLAQQFRDEAKRREEEEGGAAMSRPLADQIDNSGPTMEPATLELAKAALPHVGVPAVQSAEHLHAPILFIPSDETGNATLTALAFALPGTKVKSRRWMAISVDAGSLDDAIRVVEGWADSDTLPKDARDGAAAMLAPMREVRSQVDNYGAVTIVNMTHALFRGADGEIDADLVAEAIDHEDVHTIQRMFAYMVAGSSDARDATPSRKNSHDIPHLWHVIVRLRNVGYGSDWGELMSEVLSHALTLAPEKLGLTADQVVDLVEGYYDAMAREFGSDRARLFQEKLHERLGKDGERRKQGDGGVEISPREATGGGTRPAGSSGSRERDAGSVGLVPERRSGDVSAEAESEDRGEQREDGDGILEARPFPKTKLSPEMQAVLQEQEDEDTRQALGPRAEGLTKWVADLPEHTLDQFAKINDLVYQAQAAGIDIPIDRNPTVVTAIVAGGTAGVTEAAAIEYGRILRDARKSGLETPLKAYLNLAGYKRAINVVKEHSRNAVNRLARRVASAADLKQADRLVKAGHLTATDRQEIEDFQNGTATELAPTTAARMFRLDKRNISRLVGLGGFAQIERIRQDAISAVAINAQKLRDRKVVPGGYNESKVDSEVMQLGKDLGSKFADLKSFADRYYKLNRSVWDLLHDEGIVSDAVYDMTVARGIDYVTMRRIMDPGDEQNEFGGRQPLFVRQQRVLHTLAGSERYNLPPLTAAVQSFEEGVREANRNAAARTFIGLKDYVPGFYARPLKTGEEPGKGFGVVPVWKDGEKTRYEVDAELARVMEALTTSAPDAFGPLNVIGSLFRATATSANLAWSLPNWMRDVGDYIVFAENAPKLGLDTIDLGHGASIRIPDFLNLAGQMAKAMYDVARKNGHYLEFLKAGAAYSTLQKTITPHMFLDPAGRRLKRDIQAGRFGKLAADALMLPIEQIGKVTNLFEEATKLTAFKRAKAANARRVVAGQMTPKQAALATAYETRTYGGSPDFAVSGSFAKMIRAFYPFLPATLAGNRRFLRFVTGKDAYLPGGRGGGRRKPGGGGGAFGQGGRALVAAARVFWMSLLMGMMALLYEWQIQKARDKEGKLQFDRELRSDRDKYFVLYTDSPVDTPGSMKQWNTVKIAMPHSFQVLFNPIHAALRKAMGDDVNVTQEVASAAGQLTPFNFEADRKPSDMAAQAFGAGLNPLIREPIEQVANLDMYRNIPIEPESTQRLMPADRYIAEKTSPTAVWMGKTVGVSPLRIDHAFRSFLTGTADTALSLSDMAVDPARYARRRQDQGISAVPILGPIVRRVTGSPVGDQKLLDASERLHSNFTDAEQVIASAKRALASGDKDHAKEILRDPRNRALASYRDELNKIIEATAKTRKAMNAAVVDSDSPEEERRARVEKLARVNRLLLLAADKLNTKIEQAAQ